ncbi:major facilitator superfamily domain-containing protein [Pestalotiopsis sp. NC0098]|nr:major facilitator superfamily domain-containing protein [Pestalotiopsis sp. NC0098]
MDTPPQTADPEVRPEKSLTAEHTEPVTGIKLKLMLLSLTLASLLIFLDTSIVSTAVPQITDEFHSLSDIGWYGSAYQLGSAAFGPLSGNIFHHFSLKWTYLVFFAIFEIGSAVCGAAQSSAMLIVGRAIAGVGASGVSSGAYTILSATVPLERRPAILGMLMGIAQLGTISGPLVGGAFTTGYTWRWCFYINLPLGALVAVPLLLLHIPDQVEKSNALKVVRNLHRHLDLIGFALLAPAIVQLLLALQFGGNQFAWSSSQVIGLFCGSGATFIVWVFWNIHKGDKALLPFFIIKRREVWTSGVNYAFMMSTVFGSTYFLPIYFQAVKGVNAIMSGVYLLPIVLPQLLSAVVGGTLVTKIGYVPPFALVGGALGCIGSGLFSLFQPDTPTGEWVGFSIIAGLGRGASLQMPLIAIQSAVTPEEMSPAMAFSVWCQYIGPTIFLTLYNTIFDSSLRSQIPKYAPDVDAQAVIAAGATRFRALVSAQDLPGVLVAFSTSLDYTFYLQAGAGVIAWVSAWGMGWKDIRKKKDTALEQPADSSSTPQREDGIGNSEKEHSS